jgi:hypothetical protein
VTTTPSADELLDRVRSDLAPVERALSEHAYVAALAERRVPTGSLERLAGEQHSIISGDRRSFAYLASRYPQGPAGDLFLGLAQGEGAALGHLAGFASWLEMDTAALDAYEPLPGCQAYTAYVGWLALNGTAADMAMAFLANLPAWGGNCARVAEALRGRYGAPEGAVAFFDYFAATPPGFESSALAVVDAGLAAGDPPARIVRATRLLQAYELLFWDTLWEHARGEP